MNQVHSESIRLYGEVSSDFYSMMDRLGGATSDKSVTLAEVRELIGRIEAVSPYVYVVEHRHNLRNNALALQTFANSLGGSWADLPCPCVLDVEDESSLTDLRSLGLAA